MHAARDLAHLNGLLGWASGRAQPRLPIAFRAVSKQLPKMGWTGWSTGATAMVGVVFSAGPAGAALALHGLGGIVSIKKNEENTA